MHRRRIQLCMSRRCSKRRIHRKKTELRLLFEHKRNKVTRIPDDKPRKSEPQIWYARSISVAVAFNISFQISAEIEISTSFKEN